MLYCLLFSIYRYASNNDFRFTHADPFRDMAALTRLELQNNNVDIIPDTAFHGATSLTTL